MIRRRWVSVLGVLVAVTLLAPATWSQTAAVDPQTLVGQWSGSWADRIDGKSGGHYYLRIVKVDGDQVHCAGQFDTGREIPFVATLTGNQLRFRGKANIIELTVSDNRMNGTLTGQRNVSFSLAKEK